MSLSKEAIQLVTDTALMAAGKSLNTYSPTAILPEGAKVVDLEKYQIGRSRFRGVLATNSLVDFSAYVKERAAEGARGFIDQDEMACTLIFNLGTDVAPGHADDRAVLRLKASAGYKAVQAVPGRSMSQKELSDWIEDWNASLNAADDAGQQMSIVKAIAAVRTITIKASSESDHAISETRTSRSAMDQIEATSKETLPASLVFSVVPYEGLSVRNITLRVSVITSGAQPMLKLRWIGEEVQREEIAQEFKTVLQEKIGNAAPLSLGAFDPK